MTWYTHNAAAAASASLSLSSIHLQMTWRRPFQLSLSHLTHLLSDVLLCISYSLLVLILELLMCCCALSRPCAVRLDLLLHNRKSCASLLSSTVPVNEWMNEWIRKEITKAKPRRVLRGGTLRELRIIIIMIITTPTIIKEYHAAAAKGVKKNKKKVRHF